jgi:UDP-N-acetylglucosamine:LPS N-acetylglucosamine transferase
LTQKRLGKILKETDIAITRWWATTLWELTSFGVHSIIIPLKWSAGNHQEENAKYFHEKFWSDVLSEDNLEIELRKRLESYKKLRKWWLNLEWFYDSLRVIEKEIY